MVPDIGQNFSGAREPVRFGEYRSCTAGDPGDIRFWPVRTTLGRPRALLPPGGGTRPPQMLGVRHDDRAVVAENGAAVESLRVGCGPVEPASCGQFHHAIESAVGPFEFAIGGRDSAVGIAVQY